MPKENICFEEYLVRCSSTKLQYNYLGINRKEFPKWAGWKIIGHYRELGIDVLDISDPKLAALVRNFHYLKYIEQTL